MFQILAKKAVSLFPGFPLLLKSAVSQFPCFPLKLKTAFSLFPCFPGKQFPCFPHRFHISKFFVLHIFFDLETDYIVHSKNWERFIMINRVSFALFERMTSVCYLIMKVSRTNSKFP